MSRRLEPTLKIRAEVPDQLKKETILEARKLFPRAGRPTKANIILLGHELGIDTELLLVRRRGRDGESITMDEFGGLVWIERFRW